MMKSLWNGLRNIVGVFWKGVSAFHRFVGNILFLALVIFFLSIFLFDRGKEVPDGAALILAFSGNIVEQKTETMLYPWQRSSGKSCCVVFTNDF